MAKITTKGSLVLGTNLILHVADKKGTDITIAKAGDILTILMLAGISAKLLGLPLITQLLGGGKP